MYNYIKGKVVEVTSNYIVIDNNGIGYQVYTGNPYSFEEGKEYTVYIYQKIAEDDNSLYGFKTKEEKELFLKLIDVKGLGCKMAMPMIALGSVSGIADAIDRENILYLKKFPKIGDKVARQIILDLKGKLSIDTTSSVENNTTNELVEVLESLGYKKPDIKRVITQVDSSLTLEEQVKSALKLMLK